MHYFSLSQPDGEHLGFLVMMADDESSEAPETGQFALTLHDVGWQYEPLSHIAADERALFWRIEGDRVLLHDSDDVWLGFIRQEWLVLDGEYFLLADLTGNV